MTVTGGPPGVSSVRNYTDKLVTGCSVSSVGETGELLQRSEFLTFIFLHAFFAEMALTVKSARQTITWLMAQIAWITWTPASEARPVSRVSVTQRALRLVSVRLGQASASVGPG